MIEEYNERIFDEVKAMVERDFWNRQFLRQELYFAKDAKLKIMAGDFDELLEWISRKEKDQEIVAEIMEFRD